MLERELNWHGSFGRKDIKATSDWRSASKISSEMVQTMRLLTLSNSQLAYRPLPSLCIREDVPHRSSGYTCCIMRDLQVPIPGIVSRIRNKQEEDLELIFHEAADLRCVKLVAGASAYQVLAPTSHRTKTSNRA